MQAALVSITSQIKSLRKNRRNSLPIRALEKMEESGLEIEISPTRENRVVASVKNPLDVLLRAQRIDRDEWKAGKEYQKNYALSNISHHARPSYDGTPISAASISMGEKIPKDSQIKATAYIVSAKCFIARSSASKQVGNFKNGRAIMSRDLKLLDILEKIFENQIAIRNVESCLGINHRLIGDRVKKICQILLAL